MNFKSITGGREPLQAREFDTRDIITCFYDARFRGMRAARRCVLNMSETNVWCAPSSRALAKRAHDRGAYCTFVILRRCHLPRRPLFSLDLTLATRHSRSTVTLDVQLRLQRARRAVACANGWKEESTHATSTEIKADEVVSSLKSKVSCIYATVWLTYDTV